MSKILVIGFYLLVGSFFAMYCVDDEYRNSLTLKVQGGIILLICVATAIANFF